MRDVPDTVICLLYSFSQLVTNVMISRLQVRVEDCAKSLGTEMIFLHHFPLIVEPSPSTDPDVPSYLPSTN